MLLAMEDGVGREEFHAGLQSVRDEVRAQMSTAGVQIGAVENILTEKLKSVKVWCVTGLVGGQTIAAVAATYFGPGRTAGTVKTAAGVLAGFIGLSG